VGRIYALQPGAEAITLSWDAHSWREEVEDLAEAIAALPTTPQPLRGHLAKWPGMFARLLLTLHAIEAGDGPLPAEVAENTARMARDLMVHFFMPNAVRFYNDFFRAQDTEGVHARWIAGHVLAHKLDVISARDIKQAYRDLRQDDAGVDRAMELLWRANWVGERQHGAKGSVTWVINPMVHERFARRAELEAKRRQEEQKRIAEANGVVQGTYGDE
jgi:hypothetical protein